MTIEIFPTSSERIDSRTPMHLRPRNTPEFRRAFEKELRDHGSFVEPKCKPVSEEKKKSILHAYYILHHKQRKIARDHKVSQGFVSRIVCKMKKENQR